MIAGSAARRWPPRRCTSWPTPTTPSWYGGPAWRGRALGWAPGCAGSTMPGAARPVRAASPSLQERLVLREPWLCPFRARGDPRRRRRRRGPRPSGRTGDGTVAAGVARPFQPVQRVDGGGRRRGLSGRRPGGPGRHGGGRRRWRAASRCARSAMCGPGSCWPRTRRAGRAARPGGGSDAPLVVSINARIADGADPSWLWDVPYERLAGRAVVATGDRFRTSRSLHYGGVRHTTEPEPVVAVTRAAAGSTRWSTSSGTTPPSTTCWVRR